MKLFIKLPDRFVVPTVVSDSNLTWAIVLTVQDQFGEPWDALFLVREAKGSLDEDQLRAMAGMKIDCAKRLVEAIEVDHDLATSPGDLLRRK